jgi:hypothetical protein
MEIRIGLHCVETSTGNRATVKDILCGVFNPRVLVRFPDGMGAIIPHAMFSAMFGPAPSAEVIRLADRGRPWRLTSSDGPQCA